MPGGRHDLAPRLGMPAAGVIVTGGASGIGLACARALAAVGRPVALWDINADGARAAAREISATFGVSATGLGTDLRDPSTIAPAVEETRGEIGVIGGLVHSAGTAEATRLGDVTVAQWDAGLAVHARALVLVTQALLPDLQATPGASVVAIASINATLGNALATVYSAAKGAIVSVVRAMADDLAHDGIRINTVSPGQIATPMTQQFGHALREMFERRIMLGRYGEPEEVGRVVRFLMSEEASYVTGVEFVVDGGNICSQRQ